MALFRVTFAAGILLDLARRLQYVPLLYSNDGVLTNHYALFAADNSPRWSFLFTLSSIGAVYIFFFATLCIVALFGFGYRTRLTQCLTFLALLSIHNRMPLLAHAADAIVLNVLAWTLFLPLGQTWSLDSDRRKHADGETTFWNCPLAALPILTQIVCLYLITALAKRGTTWLEGSVVYLLLHQDRVATPLAHLLRSALPFEAFKLATWATLAVEFAIPILLLTPYKRRIARRLAVGLIAGLHLSIRAVSDLGSFANFLIPVGLLFLHPRDMDVLTELAMRFSRPCFAKLFGNKGKATETMPPAKQYDGNRGKSKLLQAVAACATALILSQAYGSNPHVFGSRPLYQVNRFMADALGLNQAWQMFAPDGPQTDGRLVIEFLYADGSSIDPQFGEPPRLDVVDVENLQRDYLWDLYTSRLIQPWATPYLTDELPRWAFTRTARLSGDPLRPVERLRVWWLEQQTSPPDEPLAPRPISKRLLLDRVNSPR